MYCGVPPPRNLKYAAPFVRNAERQSEIGYNRPRLAQSPIHEHHVVTLEIPVDDAMILRSRETDNQLINEFERLLRRERTELSEPP